MLCWVKEKVSSSSDEVVVTVGMVVVVVYQCADCSKVENKMRSQCQCLGDSGDVMFRTQVVLVLVLFHPGANSYFSMSPIRNKSQIKSTKEV